MLPLIDENLYVAREPRVAARIPPSQPRAKILVMYFPFAPVMEDWPLEHMGTNPTFPDSYIAR